MHERYAEWLTHVFDHEVEETAWYFAGDSENFEADPSTVVELITHTMLRAGEDLAVYSDGQVNQGLSYIFRNSCSNIVFSILNEGAPFNKRMAALRSVSSLYKNCFEPRCAPVLGHIDEPGATPLNDNCYMFWDASPLGAWPDGPEQKEAHRVLFEVMESSLASPNIACVEGSLHGLGHLYHYEATGVKEVVSRFLEKPHIQNVLRYAKQASVGHVL
jgi:hypothetical protein